ncbi:MAG: DUF4232 domain-containing protein [Gaiellales bacterium]
MRSKLIATGLVLGAAACAPWAASATAGAQTAAAPTPRCTTSALEVWLGLGGGGGQAGSTVYPVELTNLSAHTCSLYGFPGVSAEVAGHQVGSAAGRDHAVPAQTVTLGPRATAHAELRITDVSSIPAASCEPVTADGLTVYPPGAFTAAQIPFRFRACSAAGPAFLSVQVVQPRVGVPGH